MNSYSVERQAVSDHESLRQQLVATIEAQLWEVPNWTDWAKMPSWTAEEAAALTLGLCPQADIQEWHPPVRRFATIREMIRRACASGDINCDEHGIAPTDYLKWANQYELAMPAELAAEVARIQALVQKRPKDRPLGTRERDTLLKIILGIAVGGYGYDPKQAKSQTITEIHSDFALHGLNLDPETIRRKLKEAVELWADELSQAS